MKNVSQTFNEQYLPVNALLIIGPWNRKAIITNVSQPIFM